jgi:hypothetical protein
MKREEQEVDMINLAFLSAVGRDESWCRIKVVQKERFKKKNVQTVYPFSARIFLCAIWEFRQDERGSRCEMKRLERQWNMLGPLSLNWKAESRTRCKDCNQIDKHFTKSKSKIYNSGLGKLLRQDFWSNRHPPVCTTSWMMVPLMIGTPGNE